MERAIKVLTDIKDLAELLSGASVEHTRVAAAAGRLSLEMELTRAMPEHRQVVRQGLFRRTRTPWSRSRLTLHGVSDVTVQQSADRAPSPEPLLTCDAVPGGYTLMVTAPGGLQLACRMDQLEGGFSDVGQPIDAP